MANKSSCESHPYFPSGEWEGFYLYSSGPGAERHPMKCQLNFSEGKVSGGGSDDIGGFSWQGVYSTSGMFCRMIKKYATHVIFYDGRADESGIYGTWSQGDYFSGGFHLWPKGGGNQEEAVEEKVSAKSFAGVS